ncbi:copper amine oxidase N-terminal domain-containing protein [Sporosarcina sp. 179-K 3D1 HS]|uniref:copper amine oxidase N-terminal domain-containing protein n=1 Tax=Sporosarcina sp. 179-K 3D1 HS TaxID=3232169 RepID=UPI00399FFD54
MKRCKAVFLFLLTLFLFFGTSSHVFAANQSFIDQVRNEYVKYEKKSTTAYQEYREKSVNAYQAYHKKQVAFLNAFDMQTSDDLSRLTQLLNDDVARLEIQYGSQKEYASKLNDYKNAINPNSLSSPLGAYSRSISSTSLSSAMGDLQRATNENSLSSPMYSYRQAINENSLSSPMYSYRQTVNRNSLSSPMYALDKGSSVNSLPSVMYAYNKGRVSQKNARKKWDQLFKKETLHIQNNSKKAKDNIDKTIEKTDHAILNQKHKTVNGILKQRNKSLEEISKLRATSFGEGISFEPLLPNLNEISVMVDGEWLALKQLPIIQNGHTFIPIRSVYEKIDSSIKISKKGNVISATSQNMNVTVTIDKKNATINGKAITLDTSPKLIDGQTMVPLQLLSESLPVNVRWDAASQTIIINTK